jgi:hypothetical protein
MLAFKSRRERKTLGHRWMPSRTVIDPGWNFLLSPVCSILLIFPKVNEWDACRIAKSPSVA